MAKVLDGPEDAIYWYILQTYSAAQIAFKRFLELFPPEARAECFDKEPNQTDMIVFLAGNRRIHFKSGDNFQALRAETLHGVIIDECREQDPILWKQVVRPMLARHKGWAEFYSTPAGFDWFYDLYHSAKDNKEWEVFHAPSTEAWWWTPEEIQSAKATMSEAEFAQEIMAEFRDMAQGRAYLNFAEDNITSQCPFYEQGRYHPMLPIIIGMDFNLSPMAWTLMQKKIDNFYAFDKIWLTNSHTQEAAQVLCEKLLTYKAQDVGVIICGDATSKSGQRAAAGQSDYDIVCKTLDAYGIKWTNETPESNPGVKDRVNTMNAHLKDANGVRRLFVHPECKELIDDLYRVVWKQNASGVILDQTKDPMRTHASDGVGYVLSRMSPLTYQQSIPKMKILMR